MLRALLLLLSLSPTVAFAQDAPTVSVMAVGGTVGLEATAWTEASDAIEARLREAGYRVDDSGLPRRDDCTTVECLREERATRDVDVLVTFTLFAAEGGPDQPGSIVVSMLDADGHYVGEESVDGRVIGVVAALALAEVRSASERGPEPWVRITGSPAGAIVRIDGREVGVLPYEGRLAEGEHTVEVSLGGQVFRRTFTSRSGATEDIAVALGGEGGGSHDPIASIATGIGLIAVGAVLAGIGIANAAQAGSCVGPAPCEERVVFGASEGVLIGVGGASILGGAILVIAQPF